MKFFIDTANLEEIKQAQELGLIDGVTTNPTLIAKEKKDYKETVMEICQIVKGPVSVEVLSLDTEGMVKEAREIAAWAENIVIKIPLTKEGIVAVRRLQKEGIKTNVTLVFSVNQAILAAKVGAKFVSPFVGRLDDIGSNGMDLVADIVKIYKTYGWTTEIITASIRHPLHIIQAALIGSHIVTVPFKVIEGMFKHPLTDIGIKNFLKDAERIPKKE